MRIAALLLALLAVAAQESHPTDPKAYCWNPKTAGSMQDQRDKDEHAHRCACHLVCTYAPDGSVNGDQEDGTCQLYCKRDHCLCHVEEPCEKS